MLHLADYFYVVIHQTFFRVSGLLLLLLSRSLSWNEVHYEESPQDIVLLERRILACPKVRCLVFLVLMAILENFVGAGLLDPF